MSKKQQEQHSFVLYEYLLFFWKKKAVYAALTAILIIGAVVFSLFQPVKYEGTATFQVGDVEADRLTDVDLLEKLYDDQLPEELKGHLDVISPAKSQVMFKLVGTNKAQVDSAFKKVISQYNDDLQKQYNEKNQLLTSYQDVMTKKVAELTELNKTYREKLGKNLNNPDVIELLMKNNEQILTAQENLLTHSIDKINLDKPALIMPKVDKIEDIQITEKRLPLISNLMVAILLCLILSTCILVLWKYITDAKAHYPSAETSDDKI